MNKLGHWKQISKINPGVNNKTNFDFFYEQIKDKSNVLFIFKCFDGDKACIFGVFSSDTLENQKKDITVFEQTSGKVLRAFENQQSFLFYYNDEKQLHFPSTGCFSQQQFEEKQNLEKNQHQMKNLTQQQQHTEKESQLFLTKNKSSTQEKLDFIRIHKNGIEVSYQNSNIINLKFNNLDNSTFNYPLKTTNFFEGQPWKQYNVKPSQRFFQSAEIWQWDCNQSDVALDNYLNMFEIKQDFISICNSFLKLQREEKIIFLPENTTIGEIQNKAIFESEIYKNLEYFGGIKTNNSQIFDSHTKLSEIQQIQQNNNNKNQNNNLNILDLIIQDERINIEKINLDIQEDIIKNQKIQNQSFIIQIFDQKLEGLNKLIKKMAQISHQNFDQNLIPFFFQMESLLKLKQFSSILLRNTEFFKLLLGLQSSDTNNHNEQYFKKTSFHKLGSIIFKSLKRILKEDKSNEIRVNILKKGILSTVLNKIETIMGGLPISKKINKNILEKQKQLGFDTKIEDEKQEQIMESMQEYKNKKKEQELQQIKQKGKPKGVGYGNVSTNKEDTSWQKDAKYQGGSLEIDFTQQDHVTKLLGKNYIYQMEKDLMNIISLLLKNKYLKINNIIYEIIQSTNLVQVIIYLMQKRSLLECIQLPKLFTTLLNIIENMSNYDEILDLFVNEEYSTTIYEMLQNLKVQVDFYVKNQNKLEKIEQQKDTENQQQQKEKINQIIQRFYKMFDNIEEKLMNNQFIHITINKTDSKTIELFTQKNQNDTKSTNNFHTFFPTIMKSLACDSFDMEIQKHHYFKFMSQVKASQTKTTRLLREISDLQQSVPMEASNSIFIRYDNKRMDMMQALIFGASETPYAHGAFIFDLYFDDNYPNQAPKCNLKTTGNAQIRFNPNLYHCGKVCLSLLGTWRGSNSVENWNPNISSILQVLISIQAIVMSPYVSFNEPGHEQSMGTQDGELKNIGYQNIVKWGNIKYAMIEQIKNPPKGFEEVVKKSFFLKRDMILKEVEQWYQDADKPANYSGIVSSHNSKIVQEIQSKGFKNMLGKQIDELRHVLDELCQSQGQTVTLQEDNKKNVTVFKDKPSVLTVLKGKQNKAIENKFESKIQNLDHIDVSYDENIIIKPKKLDINNKEYENRISRVIGAVGKDAIKKQNAASVLICGMDALGIEIAKNLVLSGIKRLTIFDNQICTEQDLAGQFYLTNSNIGQNRALASLHKLQQLNHYVSIDMVPLDCQDIQELLNLNENNQFSLLNYDVIVLINQNQQNVVSINEFTRKQTQKQIFTVVSEQYGFYSSSFVDFGDKFKVDEQDSEIPIEKMLQNIEKTGENEYTFKVTVLEGLKHEFQQNQKIILKEVVEIDELQEEEQQSFNKQQFTITKIVDPQSFIIQLQNSSNNLQFKKYLRNGIAIQVKEGTELSFQSYKEIQQNPKFDEQWGMLWTEQQILNRFTIFECFKALSKFKLKYNKQYPKNWCLKDAQLLYDLIENKDNVDKIQVAKFSFTAEGCIPAQSAFLGGVLAQEVLKGITKKWIPIQQILIHNVDELFIKGIEWNQIIDNQNINTLFTQNLENIQEIIENEINSSYNDRYDKIKICIGFSNLQKIQQSKLFMIGAGAIGCELFKNFGMLGVGTSFQGGITVTDPDIIENSNLSRQFLFKEKHIRKPKSLTAAATAIAMNPHLKGRIDAKLEKICDKTENLFDDQFFDDQSIIMNALDNVQARLYVDSRCVRAQKPLIESGTLGGKGHVQVIIPHKTESYGSAKDPEGDGNEIPVCTLKMFPEEAIHCVEWAMDKFGRMFTQKPMCLSKIIESMQNNQWQDNEIKQLIEASKFVKKRPSNFQDCIEFARKKFEKLFNHNIQALLEVYPLDKKKDDGTLFWQLPKRPPQPLEFNYKNNLHMDFIITCACLRAYTFNIEIPENIKSNSVKEGIAQMAQTTKVKEFQLSQQKILEMKKQVEKEQNQQNDEIEEEKQQQQQVNNFDDSKENYIKDIVNHYQDYLQFTNNENIVINQLIPEKLIPKPSEFEKDEDDNFHIDFLTAMTNCRATNYKLDNMDWLEVKLKAGKIIPALATTTSSISGLQTIEMMKILTYETEIENYKNAFLNLCLPSMQQSEPGPALKYKIHNNLQTNMWDIWTVDIIMGVNDTIETLFEQLQKQYNIYPNDLMQGMQQLYVYDLMVQKEEQNKQIRNKKLIYMVELSNYNKLYSDVNITFTEQHPQEIQKQKQLDSKLQKQYIKGIPFIRLQFKSMIE